MTYYLMETHIEIVNDGHDIASLSFGIHDLILLQDLHDNVPIEITSFEVVPLKFDIDHSSTKEAFHCLHSESFYSLYPDFC